MTFQARTQAEGPVGVGLVDGGALIGLPVVLGTMRSHLRALVEVAGSAYRISAADLRRATWRLWAWCRTVPLRACAKPC